MTILGQVPSERCQALLRDRFEPRDCATGGPPLVAVARHVELAATLRDELGYRIFGFVVAAHYPASKSQEDGVDQIRIVYGIRTVGPSSELAAWQVQVALGETVPTLAHLFAGADWQEREQYDLVGVRFEGHPDLRRLMLPEDWEGHPLRKDYAIDTQVPPWR